MVWIEPSKRERKGNYNIEGYYKEAMRVGPVKPRDDKPKLPKAPKQEALQDYQFFSARLYELQARETAAYRREMGSKAFKREPVDGETEDDVAKQMQIEQEEIDTAEKLTEAEEEEKAQELQQGFVNWTRREFQGFVRGCEKYGRNNLDAIVQELGNTKTPEEVKIYAKTFFERYQELNSEICLYICSIPRLTQP